MWERWEGKRGKASRQGGRHGVFGEEDSGIWINGGWEELGEARGRGGRDWGMRD